MQDLQKSSFGWELASHLIQTDSPNCQFFGALTYTVKINNYSKVIHSESPSSTPPPERESPDQILNELLGALVFLSNKPGVKTHVIRKILTTLSRFFTKFPEYWQDCIASTIATIATGKPLTTANHSIGELCQNLSERNTILCLEFCQVLIEDVKNANLENSQEAKVDEIINNNINPLAVLLRYASEILYPRVEQTLILEHVFKTYGAWALNHPMGSDYILILSPVTNFIFQFIQANPDTELYQIALDEISDILNRFPSFFDKQTKLFFAHILGSTGQPMVQKIEEKIAHIALMTEPYRYDTDDDIEELHESAQVFSKAAIAICELAMSNLDSLKSPEIDTLIKYLMVISNFPGFPYVDHNLSMFMLEFWGTYADAFLDTEDSVNISEAGPCIIQVIEIFWNKITLPLPQQQAHWKTDSWQAFDSFRKDFWEFLDSTYVLVGSRLFDTLVANIMEQLNSPALNWEKLEASLSCINALSENITTEYVLIAQLLHSPLLERLSHLDSIHIRTTGVNFIGSYDSFFEGETGKPFLFPALDYLFKSLNNPSLSSTASRSIQKLCFSCREFLSTALDSFFGTYVNMSLYATLGNTSHERTVLAISYVIQAVSDLESKGSHIEQLLKLLFGQLEKANNEYEESRNSPDGPSNETFTRIVSLLRCLANVGKGLQVPDDLPESPSDQIQSIQQYWDADSFHIRSNLLQVMRIFAIERLDFKSSVDVCECCCAILKSGFSEYVPGPFVFPIDTVLEFIKAKHLTGPADCHSALIDLSCCFVSSYSVGSSSISAHYLNSLLETFFSDVNVMLEYEPETQTSNLKLLRQIFSHYLEVFLDNPKIEVMIHFAVSMMSSTDRFAMRESTFFWSGFIGISGNKRQQMVLASVGPELVETMIMKVSGDSARSELEFYSEVIRALMFKQMFLAKPWFENALILNPKHPVVKIAKQRRQMFYKQLVNLRGSRETANVIKQFWLAARGITDYV